MRFTPSPCRAGWLALCALPFMIVSAAAQTAPAAPAETRLAAAADTLAETAADAATEEAATGNTDTPPSSGTAVDAQPADEGNATPTAEATPAPPPEPTLEVSINLTNQRMTVSENGVSKYTWAISSGAYGYATPTGTYRPIWMAKMWHSRKYDMAPMPHSIFFHGGHAIHATYSIGMLGRPASHGCVRLAPSNAAKLYKLVSKHGKAATRIAVFGKPTYTSPKIAKARQPAKPRYAATYSPYSFSGFASPPPQQKFIYPGDQRAYYVNAQKRRAQMMKQRRAATKKYYSGYASNY